MKFLIRSKRENTNIFFLNVMENEEECCADYVWGKRSFPKDYSD